MLKRMSFRAKLLLVLFVPFFALVVVAGAGLNDRFDAVHAQERYGQLSAPVRSLDALSRALDNEAVVSSWYVGSRGSAATGALRSARSRTDAAVEAFTSTQSALVAAGAGGSLIDALDETKAKLAKLDVARTRIDELTSTPADARNAFLDVDSSVLAIADGVASSLSDPTVAAGAGHLSALRRFQHELARADAIYAAVLASGSPAPTSGAELTTWVTANAAQQREREHFLNSATKAEAQAFWSASATVPFDTTLPTAFPTSGVPTQELVEQYQDQARAIDQGIGAVDAVIAADAAGRADDARRDVFVYGGLAVFAMLLTLTLIWFVTRAVVRPVRKLTQAARELSQHQLPELVEGLKAGGDIESLQPTRVEVSSEDEIGELARAFNDVQDVTIEVAQEQARLLRKGMGDLFVNLARRNQSLLERQLELLDELERNEHDPTALDSLFKLDHMATRMRRNAESLLVLSGAEQPRQWQQPIALLDVVRAAAAEIADFPRVELVGIDAELAIAGRAVADLAHLVAELLENATSFSPPESPVVVSGASTATGFVLAVSDQGIGMPLERIAEANELLARPPAVGLALSRALGLHVVASLAARHDIGVELRPGAPIGVVALVTLPAAVLEPLSTDAAPNEPLFAPDLGPDGAPTALSSRRVAWRPADEPPVEEWRDVLRADQAPSAPPAPDAARVHDPEFHAPGPVAPEPPAPEPPAPEPVVFASPAQSTFETPTEEPVDDLSPYEGPQDEGPHAEGPRADGPLDEDPPDDGPLDEALLDDGPLPTRVPGQHLSHQPTSEHLPGDAAEPVADGDPLRPYRVHELLTRHEQGKRRGRAETDVLVPEDPAPEIER